MEFTVPQFIEKEAKIVGPFTFKQFIFIGAATGACLILFFIIPFGVFVIAAPLLLGGAFALAFVKVQRTSLPVYIKNLFVFIFRPKVYLWRKKSVPLKTLKKEGKPVKEGREEKPKESTLGIARGSKLRELFTYLETKQR